MKKWSLIEVQEWINTLPIGFQNVGIYMFYMKTTGKTLISYNKKDFIKICNSSIKGKILKIKRDEARKKYKNSLKKCIIRFLYLKN